MSALADSALAISEWSAADARRIAATVVPERLARLMVQEKPKPPPPPPPPPVEEKPREEPKPVPPEQRVEEARKKAEKRLANVSSALADLQRNFPVDQPSDTIAATSSERAVDNPSPVATRNTPSTPRARKMACCIFSTP